MFDIIILLSVNKSKRVISGGASEGIGRPVCHFTFGTVDRTERIIKKES
jgi:hypothetical protein